MSPQSQLARMRAETSPLPRNDGTFADALRAIQDKDYIGSPGYIEQQGEADREGVPLVLVDFGRLLVKRLRKFNVPAYVASYDGPASSLEVWHCLHGFALPDKAWLCIAHIGREVAAGPLFRGYSVQWSEHRPGRWFLMPKVDKEP